MSQQEEARRALDEDAARWAEATTLARAVTGDLWKQGWRFSHDHESELRRAIMNHVVERLRALTATAPQTQPDAWAVTRDGKVWSVSMERCEMIVSPAASNNGQWCGPVPLYRGAAPRVQETESR